MYNPMISVIMPVYNETIDELRDSIDSILSQTYSNFEYIIIDDNPNNNKIRKYITKRSIEDDRIKLIFNKYNLKLTKSENKAIDYSHGKYIVRIDADDVAYKNRLKDQLYFCIENKLDLVSSNFSLINDKNQITRKRTFNTKDIVNQDKIKNIMKYGNIAVGPTFFFKRKVVNSIGKYRNFNGEDYDLVARLLINGYKYGFQSKPLIYKRLRRNSITYHGTLPQYIAERTISKYLRKYNYSRIMPIKILFQNIKDITKLQEKDFRKYANARYTYNDNKNFINLFRTIYRILISKIVLQRTLWSVFNKLKLR